MKSVTTIKPEPWLSLHSYYNVCRSDWSLPHAYIWTGLRVYDGGSTNYQWLDGSSMTGTSLWHPTAPNHGAENCAYMRSDSYLLDDGHCSIKYSYMCEVLKGKLDIFYIHV